MSRKPEHRKGPVLGATGRYPQGRMSEDDEGVLTLAIFTKDGEVVIDFGEPVTWIACDADLAIQLATNLLKRAGQIKGVPVSLRIGEQDTDTPS